MRTQTKSKKELNFQDILNYLDKSEIKYVKVDNPTKDELTFLSRYFDAKNIFFNNMKSMLTSNL